MIKIKSEIMSILSDWGEVALDSLLNDGIKELPIVGTAFNMLKLGRGIQDRIFVEKLKTFIDNVENNNKWKEKFSNPEECEKISKQLLYIINSSDDDKKIKLIAILFNSFVDSQIDKDQYFYLSSIVSHSYFPYLEQIKIVDKDRFVNDGDFYDVQAVNHLQSLGLFDYSGATVNIISKENGTTKPGATIVKINKHGQFLRTIFNKIDSL